MSTAVLVVSLIVMVLISVIFHELMHGFVALWLGDDTAKMSGRLTLNPLSHIDPFTTVLLPLLLVLAGLPPFGAAKPVPIDSSRLKYDEFGMALVAVAGPLTNLMLAVAGAVFLRVSIHSLGPAVINLGQLFVVVNLSFFVFNLIPFPPLDGSRVLYALAPEPVQEFMRMIETMGFGAILIFMLIIFPVLRPVMSGVVDSLQHALLG